MILKFCEDLPILLPPDSPYTPIRADVNKALEMADAKDQLFCGSAINGWRHYSHIN